MKNFAISVLLASAFAYAQGQDANSSLTGKWKIHSSIAGNESDAACTFAQTNNDLSGTCPSAEGPVKLAGKVDGKKVSWSYEIQYNGSPLTMKYEGTLDAGKIAGNVTVDPFGVSGDFTAASSAASESAVALPAAPSAAPAAAAPSAAAPTADDLSLAGKWKVHSAIAGNENDASCTFAQTNSDLAGTCTSEQGTVRVKGRVDGKRVAWSYDAEYNGGPLTVKFNGTLDSGKIAGDMNVEELGVGGDFTATPEK